MDAELDALRQARLESAIEDVSNRHPLNLDEMNAHAYCGIIPSFQDSRAMWLTTSPQAHKTTRKLLKEGGDVVERYDTPDNNSMQDFAIWYLLQQQYEGDHAIGPLIDRVVVRCPKAEHIIEAVQAAG